jgi:hypothetical protein
MNDTARFILIHTVRQKKLNAKTPRRHGAKAYAGAGFRHQTGTAIIGKTTFSPGVFAPLRLGVKTSAAIRQIACLFLARLTYNYPHAVHERNTHYRTDLQ